ncbi:hypothetical protein [Nocardia sp. BMG111209]|uniref:hypothetical protein n=1 Tax=Nocardia sp. BMG111209 TaxID=1160137 RepID=UPI00350FCF0B
MDTHHKQYGDTSGLSDNQFYGLRPNEEHYVELDKGVTAVGEGGDDRFVEGGESIPAKHLHHDRPGQLPRPPAPCHPRP